MSKEEKKDTLTIDAARLVRAIQITKPFAPKPQLPKCHELRCAVWHGYEDSRRLPKLPKLNEDLDPVNPMKFLMAIKSLHTK